MKEIQMPFDFNFLVSLLFMCQGHLERPVEREFLVSCISSGLDKKIVRFAQNLNQSHGPHITTRGQEVQSRGLPKLGEKHKCI